MTEGAGSEGTARPDSGAGGNGRAPGFRPLRLLALQDHLRQGGTERQYLELTARWQAAGHEVVRLVFRRGGSLAAAAAEDGGPRPEFLQPFPSPWNWWAPGLRARLRTGRPDRVIAFGRNAHTALARARPAPTALAGVLATFRTGRPVPRGYASVLRRAEAVVANSRAAAARAGLYREGEGAPIQVIENGCRWAGRELPAREPSRLAYGAKSGEMVFLCVGAFVPGKAQELLVPAWAALPAAVRSRSRLWFVGDGAERARVEAGFRDGPEAGRVRFWGEVPDWRPLLAAADALVSTSAEESSPNALVEALWLGRPILARDCAGVGELVEDGRNGRLLPAAAGAMVPSLVAAWTEVGRDPERLRAWGAAGRAAARQRFDPAARAADYRALLEGLAPFVG